MAPAGSQPEQLSNIQPDWDAATRSFNVTLLIRASLANAASFRVETTLTVRDSEGKVLCVSDSYITPVEARDTSTGNEYVPLATLNIPCDPGDTVSGTTVLVEIRQKLLNPTGKPIAATIAEYAILLSAWQAFWGFRQPYRNIAVSVGDAIENIVLADEFEGVLSTYPWNR
jgi:hypothetical protein